MYEKQNEECYDNNNTIEIQFCEIFISIISETRSSSRNFKTSY